MDGLVAVVFACTVTHTAVVLNKRKILRCIKIIKMKDGVPQRIDTSDTPVSAREELMVTAIGREEA